MEVDYESKTISGIKPLTLYAVCKTQLSMITKISVPLSEVDEKFLKELKEKYSSHTYPPGYLGNLLFCFRKS